jgi:hypothetical protein
MNQTSESKVAYNDELGPMIEVPIKLRMPKNLYEVWKDITTNYVGWGEPWRKEGFEADVNWEVLRLYCGYLRDNSIALTDEAITEKTLTKILIKHKIDIKFLDKANCDANLIEAMLLQKGESLL